MADSAKPKTMTASTTAVHLKKLFTCSPPFELYFKDAPALISSRRLRVSSGVSPQVSRGACCLSSTRRRWPLCVRLVLFSVCPPFCFRSCRDSLPASSEYQTRRFSSIGIPPFAFNVIYIIARFYCVVYTKRRYICYLFLYSFHKL